MRPDGNSRAAINRIAQGMVEVPVRVESRADGHLRDRAQRFQLKCRADGRLKSLDHERRIAADQESAVRSAFANPSSGRKSWRTSRSRSFEWRRSPCRRSAAGRCAGRWAAPAPAQAAAANLEAAYSAPSDDAPARKLRRENEFEKLFMGISKNLQEAYWFHGHRAIKF